MPRPERIAPARGIPIGSCVLDFFTAEIIPRIKPTITIGIEKKLQNGIKEKIKPTIPNTSEATSIVIHPLIYIIVK